MRIKEFQSFLRSRKIDSAVIFNPDGKINKNFIYFTDVSEVKGYLVVPARGEPALITSILECGIAKRHSRIKKVRISDRSFMKTIRKHVKGRVIGIDYDNVSVSLLNSLKKSLRAMFVDVSSIISDLRMIKTSEEISRIKKASQVASSVISKAIRKASSRMTEIELARFIDAEIFNLGLKNSFPTIVASGANSHNPHHVPSGERLRGFTVIDMGVIYRNYCSDITRTCYIGRPSGKELQDYGKVLEVQEKCVSMNGKSPKELNDYAKKELGRHFVHSLGHGLGLDVHENPFSTYDKPLKKGMVITIEPGLYDKHGIRIEDDILVGKNNEVLTKFTKKLIVKN